MDPLILAFLLGVLVGFALDQYILPMVVDRWVRWARMDPPRNGA
jgi:hypothetical protein